MSLDSKENRIKEFNKLLTNFKALKPRNPKTQLKNKRVMKNIDKPYNVYKNDYDADNGLNEAKRKKLTTDSSN